MEARDDRYDRQSSLIEGWDQSKLSDATIAIIGTGLIANYVALNAAALGFGTIEVYGTGLVTKEHKRNYSKQGVPDYSDGFLYFDARVGKPKVKALADLLSKINPTIDVYGINLDVSRTGNVLAIGEPDLVIDATNDSSSKLEVFEYCKYNRPVISVSAVNEKGRVGTPDYNYDDDKLHDNLLFTDLHGRKEGVTTSCVVASLAVDEARKVIMPLGDEKPLEDIVVYSPNVPKRFSESDAEPIDTPDLSNYSIMQGGAGALGTFTALEWVLNNVGTLHIFDDDTVEQTNLNRQVLYWDAVGEHKAEALSKILEKINPRVNFEPHIQRLDLDFKAKSFFNNNEVDLVVETFDNDKSRALVNYLSICWEKKLLSGGTKYDGGHTNLCIPKETACLNHQADIDKYALKAYAPQSCIFAAEASVITSNQITGGLMVGEGRTALNSTLFGPPSNLELKYQARPQSRLAFLPPKESICKCYGDKKFENKWLSKMVHLYRESEPEPKPKKKKSRKRIAVTQEVA